MAQCCKNAFLKNTMGQQASSRDLHQTDSIYQYSNFVVFLLCFTKYGNNFINTVLKFRSFRSAFDHDFGRRIHNASYEKLVDESEKSIPANVFQPKTEQVFLKTGRHSFIFIVRCRHQKVTCGAVVKDAVRFEQDLAAFWRMTGINTAQVLVSEVTLRTMESMLRNAYRSDFIVDDDEILEHYGIHALIHDRFFKMEENIIQECPGKLTLKRAAHEMLCDESVIPELDRIFAGAGRQNVKGHSVIS